MNDNRRRLYQVLLNDPSRSWTVRELSDAAPTVASESVRDIVNQLLAQGLMRQVPHRRALTAALTDNGLQALNHWLRSTRAPAPPTGVDGYRATDEDTGPSALANEDRLADAARRHLR